VSYRRLLNKLSDLLLKSRSLYCASSHRAAILFP